MGCPTPDEPFGKLPRGLLVIGIYLAIYLLVFARYGLRKQRM
jgi:hypothetical protein